MGSIQGAYTPNAIRWSWADVRGVCEGQLNYVSEDGGAISTSVLIDSGGLRPVFQHMGVDTTKT